MTGYHLGSLYAKFVLLLKFSNVTMQHVRAVDESNEYC